MEMKEQKIRNIEKERERLIQSSEGEDKREKAEQKKTNKQNIIIILNRQYDQDKKDINCTEAGRNIGC